MTIYTARDARNEKMTRDYLADLRIQRLELQKKVRHWESRAEKFGGEIHKATAAKFRAKLEAL